MNGSETIEMTINIGGEFLKLNSPFDLQGEVRDAEDAVRQYINKLRQTWPQSSDKKLLAMAAYQFSFWLQEQKRAMSKAIDIAEECTLKAEKIIKEFSENV